LEKGLKLTNFTVITSINPATKAVKAFSKIESTNLIVVGDLKTPEDWQQNNATFIPIQDHATISFELDSELPRNHYCRKIFGYIHAIRDGASSILDTDDDNIPKETFSFPSHEGEFGLYTGIRNWANPYKHFTKQSIWPRGLPIDEISSAKVEFKQLKHSRVGIWQGLSDGDPDVDAIYRLTSNMPCIFEKAEPIVLDEGTFSPINSQNTLFVRELFPLLYLPSTVTFRFTDILRGIVAQPIMWEMGYRLGFCEATVVQERNPHDYFQDFISEIPMYSHSKTAAAVALASIEIGSSIQQNLVNVYRGLANAGVVKTAELTTLNLWLESIEN